jgi:cyanate permease
VWLLACIGFAQAIGVYSLNFWLPQEVKSFSTHYSNTTVGLLVMIPYLVALVSMILVSRSSDRRRPPNEPDLGKFLDLHMLVMLGGANEPSQNFVRCWRRRGLLSHA